MYIFEVARAGPWRPSKRQPPRELRNDLQIAQSEPPNRPRNDPEIDAEILFFLLLRSSSCFFCPLMPGSNKMLRWIKRQPWDLRESAPPPSPTKSMLLVLTTLRRSSFSASRPHALIPQSLRSRALSHEGPGGWREAQTIYCSMT